MALQYRIVFHYLRGQKQGISEVFPLSIFGSELKIGRDAVCDVRFDAFLETEVSRHHASLHWHAVESESKDGSSQEQAENAALRFELVDLISSNGTFVNNQRIEHACALQSGDLIEFGRRGPVVRVEILTTEGSSSEGPPQTLTLPAIQI